MRPVASLLATLLVVVCVGCSTDPSGGHSERVAPATSPLAIVRLHRSLAPQPGTTKLERVADGFALRDAPATALQAALPAQANGAIRLANGAVQVQVDALGVARAPASVEGSALVYRDVAPATDMVLSPTPGGVEELRVLRDARAPTTLRWKVTPPPGGTARVTAFGVEVLDAKGVLVAAAAPLFALDAKDVRRDVPVRFDGGALVARVDTAGLAFPVVVDPVWSSSGDLRSVRGAPPLVALSDGKVMVIPNDTAPYVDIYDPVTKTWGTGPNIPISWTGANGIALADGSVLVVGAQDTSFARFNYPAKTWTTFTQTQIGACTSCVLARMNDGRVLKIPGSGKAVEIFNPSNNTWTAAAVCTYCGTPMANPVVLDDGRVFSVDESLGQTGRIYDPATNSWSTTTATGRHANARLAKLKDGRVMVIGEPQGGSSPPPVYQIWDPATGTWSPTYNFVRDRTTPAVITLPSGRVMVISGGHTFGTTTEYYDDAELWDPSYNAWVLTGTFPAVGRENAGVAPLPGGSVLIAGGTGPTGMTSTTVRYDPLPDGSSCTPPEYPVTCAALYCVDGVCCNSASCPGGTCAAPAVAGRAAGTCALNLGQACTKASDCASDFCVDGVCCDSACDGQCAACNLPPSPGTCRAVLGQPIGGRPVCAGATADCGASCDGSDTTQCHYDAAGTVACGTDSCSSGTETKAGTCDGAGACTTTTQACGAYDCGATACKHSCAADTDCVSGYYCAGDQCLPTVGLGSPCTASSMCPSGLYCTDGVCCGVQACDAGASCAAGPVKGTCSKLLGTACSADADCASNHCVDGVCCNSVCDGQCEACDLSSTRGTCSPVVGAPHGTKRTPCDDGSGDVCKKRTCDGNNTTACDGYASGATVQCQPASCDAANLVPKSSCDGAGSCVTPPVASCGRYACDVATLSCRTDCNANADCATGFSCVGGVCSQGARCSDDGLSSMSTDGVTADCEPFICGTDGTCLKNCATSDDCAPGSVCDSTTRLCTAATSPSGASSGGCAVGGSAPRAPGMLFGMLLAAGLALSRRRARR